MLNHNGTYVVFESSDFCGKTTLSEAVNKALLQKGTPNTLTKHPGATPLGKHLRQLVKQPHTIDGEIKIDPLSAQLLMMVDQVCFINTILTPRLANQEIVLADRSNFISGIVYGLAEGLKTTEINRLLQLINSPTPDIVYILQADWDTIIGRMRQRTKVADRFEDNGLGFIHKVNDLYNNLLTGNPEILVLLENFVPITSIIYIDSTKPLEQLVQRVVGDIETVSKKKRLAYLACDNGF